MELLRPFLSTNSYFSKYSLFPVLYKLLKFLTSLCVCSVLMRTLRTQVRNWCMHWPCASGTDAYCEHTDQELMRALSIRVRNWCVHWAYESGTDFCTERTYEIWNGTFKTCWAVRNLWVDWFRISLSPYYTHAIRLQTLRLSKKLGVLNVDVVYSDSRSKKGIEIPATGRVGTPIRNTK